MKTTAADFILRGVTKNGTEMFFTGKAGAEWVSADRGAAFTFGIEGARRSALLFNSRIALHGIWFVAIPAVAEETV